MKFKCPQCQKTLTVKDEFAGRRGRCPACKAAIVAPQRPQSAQPNAASSASDAPKQVAQTPPQAPTPSPNPPFSPSPPASKPQPSEPLDIPPPPPILAPSHDHIPVPPPLPPDIEVLFRLPDSFWTKLVYCTEKERKELAGLIIGAAVIGLVAGYWWGGLFDPWAGEKKAFAAVVNLLLFGGWGAAEVFGLLIARNFKLAKRQGNLLLASAICGGLWVGLWSAVDMMVEPLEGLPLPVNVVIGFLVGLLIGGGISAISSTKASKVMFLPDRIVPHRPIRLKQRPVRRSSSSSRGWKIALWIGGGVFICLIIGGVVVGTLVYRTMNTFREFQQKFETERLTIEPITPIPYPAASQEENLLKNGTFQDLIHWERYEQIAPEDLVSLTAESNYVVWTRTNSREESGALGVYQDDQHIDLSGAKQVMVDVDVWVGGQSLTGIGEWTETAGITGEMPVHLEITYLDANGEKFLWDCGFLVYGFSMAENVKVLEKAVWTHFSFDLLDDTVRINPRGDLLPSPTTITKVMVYGNGWDFSGAIGNLSIRINGM